MHGVVVDSLGEFLAATYGPKTAALVLGDRSYSTAEAYPDEELSALVGRTAGATGREIDDVYRSFGRYTALETFRAMYPDYYDSHTTARTFLLGIQEQIHRVVRLTIPGAYPPYLAVVPFGANGVVVTYTSARRLCRLLEGLVTGTAEHFGERADMDETQCMQRGDPACAFHVVLERA
jgi:predicted hydrocarbon binding protein